MKRVTASTAAALLAAVLFSPFRASAVSAERAVVVDAVSGRHLYDKNADSRSLIASTTKMMTALMICENCNVLDQMAIPKEAVGIEGSSVYLQEGEILTLQELLYCLMLSSGNDAAVALALYCSGGIPEFADQMNDKARELGMTNTHFANPHGLDHEQHYSTASDLAKLAVYAMNNPIFQKTVSTKTIKVGERYLRNHNKLLWMYPEADGIKTGYTKAAGRILASSAKHDDRRLVAVTINAPDDWRDHQALYQRCFADYAVKRIVTKGECVGYRAVSSGNKTKVPIIASENFAYSIAPGESPQILLPGKGALFAPVTEDSDAGYAYVILSGNAIGKVHVVYGETIEEKAVVEKRSLLQRILKYD